MTALDTIEELLKQATPGWWSYAGGDDYVFVERPNIAHVGVAGQDAHAAPFCVIGVPGAQVNPEADAQLIALLKNCAPELISYARKWKAHEDKALAATEAK